jgi:hypothetical protein
VSGIAAGTAVATTRWFLAAVHRASLEKDTVVTVCEAPPPGLAFTAALNMSNNHIFPSSHHLAARHYIAGIS